MIRNRSHIAAFQTDMGVQKMQTGGDAGGFHLVQHGLQVGIATGIAFPKVGFVIVATGQITVAAAEHTGIVEKHHMVAHLLGPGNVSPPRGGKWTTRIG